MTWILVAGVVIITTVYIIKKERRFSGETKATFDAITDSSQDKWEVTTNE